MIAGKYGWCLEKQLQAGGVEMLGKKTWNKAPLRNKQETVSGKIRTNTENIFEQLTEESPVSDSPPPYTHWHFLHVSYATGRHFTPEDLHSLTASRPKDRQQKICRRVERQTE